MTLVERATLMVVEYSFERSVPKNVTMGTKKVLAPVFVKLRNVFMEVLVSVVWPV